MIGMTWAGSAPAAPVSVDMQSQEQALSAITGIGPTLSKKLAAMGVSLFDIAEWNVDDIDRIDAKVKIKNHGAEEWPEQARSLLEAASVVVNGEDSDFGGAEPQAAAPGAVPRPADFRPRRVRRRLNPNEKHSEIIGKHLNGAAFEQDGRFFNRDGLEVFEDGSEEDADVEAPISMTVQTMAKNINLKAWLDGKAEYPFPLVRRVIKERTGRYCASPTSARDFLLHRAKII